MQGVLCVYRETGEPSRVFRVTRKSGGSFKLHVAKQSRKSKKKKEKKEEQTRKGRKRRTIRLCAFQKKKALKVDYAMRVPEYRLKWCCSREMFSSFFLLLFRFHLFFSSAARITGEAGSAFVYFSFPVSGKLKRQERRVVRWTLPALFSLYPSSIFSFSLVFLWLRNPPEAPWIWGCRLPFATDGWIPSLATRPDGGDVSPLASAPSALLVAAVVVFQG